MKSGPSQNCTSCGTQIYFVRNPETGKTVPVNSDGYSHFTTCPNASQHSKRPAAKPAPATSKHQLTPAQKRLWAVISANNLPAAKEGAERDERIEMCNQALTAGGFQAITSFNQLSDEEVAYLVKHIESGTLFWGQAVTA